MGKKWTRFKEINRGSTEAIKEAAEIKLQKAKCDKRHVLLILIDIVLIFLIVAVIYFYLDPETSVAEFPYNLIAFVAFLVAVIWIYHYTGFFRTTWKKFDSGNREDEK